MIVDWCRDQSRMWEQQQSGYGHLNKLLPDVVFSWSSNFSLLLSTTAELLPEVRMHLHWFCRSSAKLASKASSN
jgi:hypothetical protein